ncbi:hypothetical protein BC834DRAFT_862043 [Gloeopeniophorella convolvens]|nr:hypothetical protein BC834DRAFT_862043 [Gloeopeniophorella convolvens]
MSQHLNLVVLPISVWHSQCRNSLVPTSTSVSLPATIPPRNELASARNFARRRCLRWRDVESRVADLALLRELLCNGVH